MTDFPEHGSASIEINASPEAVWALVADITRMGEYSPECVHAAWENGFTGPEVGAHFDSDLGTTWRYEFAPSGAGTTATESVNAPLINVEGSPSNFDGRHGMLIDGMNATLAAIKAAAEA